MDKFASIAHGAQMAVDEAGGEAGKFRIEYVPLTDDKQQADGSYHWDADVELANARRAAADPDAMAYIGTYNSGAAKISIPVLNRVRLAMISPGNTYPGLTKPGTGTAGEPWTYYPLGVQNYFRVVPADDLQGAAAAAYAQQIGAKSVYVMDDTELYGHGIAVIFARGARRTRLAGRGGDRRASTCMPTTTARWPAKSRRPPRPGLLRRHHAKPPGARPARPAPRRTIAGAFMGADGIADEDFIKPRAGEQRRPRSIATLVGLPADKLTGAGRRLVQRYISRYPNDSNRTSRPSAMRRPASPSAPINKAGNKDREAIRAAIAATKSTDLGADHPGRRLAVRRQRRHLAGHDQRAAARHRLGLPGRDVLRPAGQDLVLPQGAVTGGAPAGSMGRS